MPILKLARVPHMKSANDATHMKSCVVVKTFRKVQCCMNET